MSQDLSEWLHEHQPKIQQLWWEEAHKTDLLPETVLNELAREVGTGLGSLRAQILASLSADSSPNPAFIDALAQELRQSESQVLINALRLALFGLLMQVSTPPGRANQWCELEGRLNRVSLALAKAFETRMDRLDLERNHWQTLYNVTRELTTSMDLSYVLQNALARILDVLHAQRGGVLLLDTRTNRVTPRATQDWENTTLELVDLPTDWQRGYGKSVVLRAKDAEKSTLSTFVRDETETVIASPLLANGQFHGVLTIATADAQGFDQKQLDLIDAVVSNLASNLGNSEVIQTLNDQARELGIMLRQLQEDSSKREAILASIADGVVFNDQRGRIVLVNRAAELILNAAANSLIDSDLQNLFELFTAGAREDLLKAMRAILANPMIQLAPEAAQTVLEIDSRIINAHIASVITERDEFLGIVTALRDITKEVEADRAKSEFVSTVSHELRTPMTAIKGYTDLIHSGMVGEINENQKRFLGIIKTNTDRLTALINDLLDISRIETGRVRFEPVSTQLGDITKNVIDALAPNAENKQLTLTFSVEAGLPEIMADPDRLNQVFTNLIGNAINYTPDGGRINVDVYRVEDALRVDVRDSGIGIHAKDLPKVFERFYRADHPLVQESRGTGLGLPIVKMFVEMHGGRVWAQSQVGKGSTFTVLLPLPTLEQEEGVPTLASDIGHLLEKRHILIADDDPDIAELVKYHLEEIGYRVTAVGRGKSALEIARQQCPDLIILDVLLPDMDGRAVLEALKTEPDTADIPVLVLTVVVDDGTAFDLGAAGYLNKPIDVESLCEAVRVALSRRGRVLVVEDDVDTIEMMRIALRRVGYNVDVAADGYEALTMARRWRPQAIVLDLRLPGMDGYEALTHLKRSLNTQDIPIIVVSAHVADWESEGKRLTAMGVEGLLPKPFTVNQLVNQIDHVLTRVRQPKQEEQGELPE